MTMDMKFFSFLTLTGIAYMNARVEVAVGASSVVVKILHGHEKIRAFINNIEQNATETTCKFHSSIVLREKMFSGLFLFFNFTFQSHSDTIKSL